MMEMINDHMPKAASLQKQIPKILAKVAITIGLETNSINKKENILLASTIKECNCNFQELHSCNSIWK